LVSRTFHAYSFSLSDMFRQHEILSMEKAKFNWY
jgi:hypothetical protein